MNHSELTEHKIDRAGWPKGEWDNEPDRIDFEAHGYACLMLRNHFGVWCGYVGVPLNHPICNAPSADAQVDVHGGITYTGECRPPICHVAKPGMPDRVMWYGFDCAHFQDFAPGMYARELKIGLMPERPTGFLKYRNARFARSETRRLAQQLRKIEVSGSSL